MLLGLETHPANLPAEARPLLLQHCRLSVVCLCTLVGKESRLELAMPPASARCAALADADTEVLTGGPDAGDLAANRRCRGSEMSRGPRPACDSGACIQTSDAASSACSNILQTVICYRGCAACPQVYG